MGPNATLKDFLSEIDRYQSMSKAANALFVTQPYISQTVHKQEKKLGVLLVEHRGKGTQLTFAGQRLLQYLIEQDRNYSRMRREMASIAQYQSGVIRIGTNQPLGHYLLPEVLSQFRQRYPHLEIILTEMATDKGAYLLENDQLELFCGMQIDKKQLTYVPITQEPYYVAASGESTLVTATTAGKVTLLQNPRLLNGQPLISIPSDSRFQQRVEDYLVTQRVDYHRIAVVPDLDLAADLVRHQTGVTFSIRSTLKKLGLFDDPKVAVFQIPVGIMQIDSGVSYKSGGDPAINDLVTLILANLKMQLATMPKILV